MWKVSFVPLNGIGGHLILVHLSISLELWQESYKDILRGQIPLVKTIQTFDPDPSIFTKNQQNRGSIKSHCQHVENVISLGQKIVEHHIILKKYESVHPTVVSDNNNKYQI